MSEKMQRFFIVLWILATPLTSCAGVTPDTEMIDRGMQSAKKSDVLLFFVITEDEVLKKIHQEIHAHELLPTAAPKVDFHSSFVLFITMGAKPSTGYGIDIDAISRRGDTLEVKIITEVPDPNRFYATVMTQPYLMLAVKEARGLKKVVFRSQAGLVIESLPVFWP